VRRGIPDEMKSKLAAAHKEMATGEKGFLYAIYQIEHLHDAVDSDYDPLRDVGQILDIDFEEYVDK
jgi:ABC-type phosphate/phosphonate transport system substrate-binding protein